jgi:hypothetical protein
MPEETRRARVDHQRRQWRSHRWGGGLEPPYRRRAPEAPLSPPRPEEEEEEGKGAGGRSHRREPPLAAGAGFAMAPNISWIAIWIRPHNL